jgi:hypothetical protein
MFQYPFENVKSRIQARTKSVGVAGNVGPIKPAELTTRFIPTVKEIYKVEGLTGFWKGTF